MEPAGNLLGSVISTTGSLAVCRLNATAMRGLRAEGKTAHNNGSVGALLRIDVPDSAVFASIISLAADETDAAAITVELDYIGEAERAGSGGIAAFQRGVNHYPQPGDSVSAVTPAELQAIFAPPEAPHVTIGTVYPTQDTRAPVHFDTLLGRHFAIVGSSGAGKSTALALMVHRIIENAGHAHVLILDPHGEYAHAFGDLAQLWEVGNLRMPYWALNLEEHCDAFIAGSPEDRVVDGNILATCLQKARANNIEAGSLARITADTPVAYQLRDLSNAIEAEAGRLERLADAHRYTRLRLTIEQFFNDKRFAFLFNGEHANVPIEVFLAEILRIPGRGKPVSIIDLAGVPTEIVNVVVSTLARLIMDYATWAPRDSRAPILMVCEEAHRYLPRVKTPATWSVERQLERIAREGRKHGVCLGLVSQRPSELSETALSQCGTIVAMRLNNQNDHTQLSAALGDGARALAGSLATLKDRECIISGEGVPLPMRVMIDHLDKDKRPTSNDPLFSRSWSDDHAGSDMLAQTVRRWRSVR